MNSVVWGRAASALLFLFFCTLKSVIFDQWLSHSLMLSLKFTRENSKSIVAFLFVLFPLQIAVFLLPLPPKCWIYRRGPHHTWLCVCVYECMCGFREVSWKHWHHHLSFVCPKLSHVTTWRDLVSVLRNNLRVKAVTALWFLHTCFLIHIEATFSKREFAF